MSVMDAEKKLDTCTTCHGTGQKQAHSVHVKISFGIVGLALEFSLGQGEAGFNGGPLMETYVVVNVEPSDKEQARWILLFTTNSI